MADIKKLLESFNKISESEDKSVKAPQPRNVVAKNAKTAGAGRHKNPKEIAGTRQEKHKKDFLKDIHEEEKQTRTLRKIQEAYNQFKQDVAEGLMGKIADKVMGRAPTNEYHVGQTVRYEMDPPQEGGRGIGTITKVAKDGVHYLVNGKIVNHFEIKGVERGVAEGYIEQQEADKKKNNPQQASVRQNKDGYTALVTDKNSGKPTYFGGATWQTPELAIGHAKAYIKGFPYMAQEYAERFIDKHRDGIVEPGLAEAGPFSYGAKKPRKGSVADLAAQKRKEQEQGKQPIEPRDQMVGVAKVLPKDVAEGTTPKRVRVEVTDKGAVYVNNTRITGRDTKWGSHQIIAQGRVRPEFIPKWLIKNGFTDIRLVPEYAAEFGIPVQQGMAEGVTSPEIKQAYSDIMKTKPHTPERKAAVKKYQALRADALEKKQQGVKEAGTVPTMPTSPTSATSTGTTSATQQKPLNLQAVQQQLKIPGNPAPGATGGTAAKPEDMAVQAIIQKVTAGKTLDPAETNLWHSILQKAK